MQITATHSAAVYGTAGPRHGGRQASTGQPQDLASLQARLQQLKHQLSDCVNCASASTLAGQKQIQEINAQILQVQTRLDPSGPAAAAFSVSTDSAAANSSNSDDSRQADRSAHVLKQSPSAASPQIDIYV